MKNKTKIFKIVLTIIVLIIMLGIAIYLIPVMTNLSTIEGQQEFKAKVEKSGILGMLALFGLEFAQIFLIIVPGEPIEILSGMCYGTLGGTIFIMASAGIISTLIIMLVKKYGREFVCLFCNEEKINKIENSKIFQNPKQVEKIMLILFFVPGTPKDLLVYIAGLLPINMKRFIILSTLARFPSVISSTWAGANLSTGNWKMSILAYLVIFIIVGIIMFIINKLDKNKITKNVIKIIK